MPAPAVRRVSASGLRWRSTQTQACRRLGFACSLSTDYSPGPATEIAGIIDHFCNNWSGDSIRNRPPAPIGGCYEHFQMLHSEFPAMFSVCRLNRLRTDLEWELPDVLVSGWPAPGRCAISAKPKKRVTAATSRPRGSKALGRAFAASGCFPQSIRRGLLVLRHRLIGIDRRRTAAEFRQANVVSLNGCRKIARASLGKESRKPSCARSCVVKPPTSIPNMPWMTIG